MVADDERGGELSVLDKQLLTVAIHTHTHTVRQCSTGGYGCSGNRNTKTNQTRFSGSAISDVLALAVSGEPGGRGTEAFDPDPHIADYESGKSLFDAWVWGVPYPGAAERKGRK